MDLAIASRREGRDYANSPLDPASVDAILDAGRAAGSARNRQSRRFVVVRAARARVQSAVTRPENLDDAALIVAIVTKVDDAYAAFDAGRAAQNMLLSAWASGIGSCPNAIADQVAMAAALEVGPDERVGIVLSFGRPLSPVDVGSRSVARWRTGFDRFPRDSAVSVS